MKNKKVIIAIGAAVGMALIAFGQTEVEIMDLASAVSNPQIVNVTNNAVVTVFANNPSRSKGRVILRTIQNTGTVPFLYLINSTNVSTANYHGVVAGGALVRDGLGSILDLSKISYPISLTTETGGTTVSVIELTQ